MLFGSTVSVSLFCFLFRIPYFGGTENFKLKKKLKKKFFSHFFFLEVISTINTRFSSIGTILIRKPEVRQNGTSVNFRNSPKQLCRACGAYRAAIFIDSSKVIKGEILSIVYWSFHVITTFWYDLRFGSYRPGKSSGYLILVVPKISIFFLNYWIYFFFQFFLFGGY